MRLRNAWPTTALAFASLAGLASEARAQACLGFGAAGGQAFVVGRVAVEADAWTPGGTLGYNAAGAVSVAGTFDHTLIDDTALAFRTVTVALAVELPGDGVSICAVGFSGYEWLLNANPLLELEMSQDGFVFGGGLAIGNRFEGEGAAFAFVPRAAAGIVHTRAGLQNLGAPAAGGQTFGRFEAGLTVVRGRIFVGPSVRIDTLAGSDAVFTGALGIAF